ncbi:MAG: hypothetical protein ACYDBJ_03485 [Aggregatilineales bacterium]
MAHALSAAGASVFVNDINPDRADRIAEAIKAAGGKAIGWQADMAIASDFPDTMPGAKRLVRNRPAPLETNYCSL